MKLTKSFAGLIFWFAVIVIFTLILTSCKKEKIASQSTQKTFVRVQSVDNDGTIQNSEIVILK